LLQWGSIVLMITLPSVHYPVSQTLAIAIDVLGRPPKCRKLSQIASPTPKGG